MKKIIFLPILIVVASIVFYSCKKNKDEKALANFTYNYIANGGVEVTFTGNGLEYWDFGGDGVQVGTGQTIRYYYASDGVYVIKNTAKAYTTGTDFTTNEKIITLPISGVPTKVKITSVKLTDFRTTNDANAPWDSDLSGPDIKFAYDDFIMGYQDLTGLLPNLQSSQLPVFNTLTVPKIFDIATTGDIKIVCYDDNYSNIQPIEFLQLIFNNVTSKSNCSDNCSIYPSKYSSNSKIEIEIEWLP